VDLEKNVKRTQFGRKFFEIKRLGEIRQSNGRNQNSGISPQDALRQSQKEKM
jgi:hypothetical protein